MGPEHNDRAFVYGCVWVQVDGQSNFPWPLVFIIPFVYLSGVMLLAVVVAVSLTCARGRARLKDLLIPVSALGQRWCWGRGRARLKDLLIPVSVRLVAFGGG